MNEDDLLRGGQGREIDDVRHDAAIFGFMALLALFAAAAWALVLFSRID